MSKSKVPDAPSGANLFVLHYSDGEGNFILKRTTECPKVIQGIWRDSESAKLPFAVTAWHFDGPPQFDAMLQAINGRRVGCFHGSFADYGWELMAQGLTLPWTYNAEIAALQQGESWS